MLCEPVDKQPEAGIDEPDHLDWVITILLVPKNNGTLSFCVVYRPLNVSTRPDGYLKCSEIPGTDGVVELVVDQQRSKTDEEQPR